MKETRSGHLASANPAVPTNLGTKQAKGVVLPTLRSAWRSTPWWQSPSAYFQLFLFDIQLERHGLRMIIIVIGNPVSRNQHVPGHGVLVKPFERNFRTIKSRFLLVPHPIKIIIPFCAESS